MNEQKLKEQAMYRYEQGESPKNIYTDLGKGKTWFFKWLKRYKSGDPNWTDEQSRRPHNIQNKIDPKMEQAVIDTRERLTNTLYAQFGAQNIAWELNQSKTPMPSLTTINRIVKRNNLTRKRPRYEPKGKKYPAVEANQSNVLHQMDTIGPRYLKSDGRFYSINIIDACDRRADVNPVRRQNKDAVIAALLGCWQTIGIPVYLQMDNTLATQGSHKYPRSFGLVIRLCLYLGIQPVFIPIREPWRNGIVERFNDDFDKRFFRAQFFKNFKHLCEQAVNYERYHCQNHRYSTLNGHTPQQHCTGVLKTLPMDFKIPEKLAIVPGHIHLFRFIRSNRIVDIFSEKFPMPMSVEYEYVRAMIDTEKQKLFVYHDDQIAKEFDYQLPKTAMDISKIEL